MRITAWNKEDRQLLLETSQGLMKLQVCGDDYEQGAFATYELRWDDRSRKLTIGPRQGEFPGMVRRRVFHVVWVRRNHGVGVEETKRPDVAVPYDGEAISVSRPR